MLHKLQSISKFTKLPYTHPKPPKWKQFKQFWVLFLDQTLKLSYGGGVKFLVSLKPTNCIHPKQEYVRQSSNLIEQKKTILWQAAPPS